MGNSLNPQSWSATPADNDDADSSINWSEGQAPSTVNNSARGIMAAVKKYVLDVGGELVAGGSANAITLTTNQSLSGSHIAAGLMLSFRVVSTNTGAVTLNPDSTGAVAVVDQSGSALAAGALVAGMMAVVMYQSDSSNWRLVSASPATGTTAVASGGTGATTAAAARTNLGVAVALLASGTVSNASSLDIDISSYTAYRGLKFILSNFHPVTDAANLEMKLSIDGSTFPNNGLYVQQSLQTDEDGGATNIFGDGGNGLTLFSSVDTNGAAQVNLEIDLLNPFATSRWPLVTWFGTGVANSLKMARMEASGGLKSTDDVTDVRFLFSSGNIADGSYAVQGLL